MKPPSFTSIVPCRQRGAVLIISLMLLIILTMLGISALDSTKLETKMAANTAELNRALQIAEMGLKIPITYTKITVPVDKIADIAARGDANPLPPEYYRLGSNNQLVSAGSGVYLLEVQTIRSSNLYADKSGSGRCSGNCVLNFIVKSTGRSREDVNAPKIVLKGGMLRFTVASSNSNNSRGITTTIGDEPNYEIYR